MKTLSLFLLSGMILFLIQPNAVACDLNPSASISTDPSGLMFIHGDTVVLDGTGSTANCGSINQYRWQIDGVTISWSSSYSHIFELAPHETERQFLLTLRVRNTSGNYDTDFILLTIKRQYTRSYYLTDHLGSIRVTVNEQGDPVGWDDYYPFGLQMPGRTQNQSNPNDDQKFTSYELEQQGDLGLYHAGARMYDPVIGRFNSQDRFKEKYPSMSPYQYAALNPISFIDVNGDSVVVAFYPVGNETSPVYHAAIIHMDEETGNNNIIAEGFPEGSKLVGKLPVDDHEADILERFGELTTENTRTVPIPEGMSEENFVESMTEAFESYDNSANYLIVTQNSNSLAGSVLRKAGSDFNPSVGGRTISLPGSSMPFYVPPFPGWNHNVPLRTNR